MNLLRLFKGRINRRNWAYGLLSFVAAYVLLLVLIVVPFHDANNPLANIIIFVFLISAFIFNISLHVRRLHDIGKSGWFLLVLLLPLVNIFGFLYLAFKEGKDIDNEYGKKPPNQISYPKNILRLPLNKAQKIIITIWIIALAIEIPSLNSGSSDSGLMLLVITIPAIVLFKLWENKDKE